MFKEPSEVLEVAIRIEREGVSFYTKLSENAVSAAARDVFSYLAAEEENHIGTFRKLLEEAADYIPKFSYPGEFGVFIDELGSLALDAFNQSTTTMYEKDFNAAISLGILVELESILFYKEICELFPEEQQKVIEKIITEEKCHLLELKAIKAKNDLDRKE
jgi:rubrerythrin